MELLEWETGLQTECRQIEEEPTQNIKKEQQKENETQDSIQS